MEYRQGKVRGPSRQILLFVKEIRPKINRWLIKAARYEQVHGAAVDCADRDRDMAGAVTVFVAIGPFAKNPMTDGRLMCIPS
jgi:hypothetical protein